MTISKDLLDSLACPKCKGNIILSEDGYGLICLNCRLIYEIEEGIPIMLVEKAKSIK